MEGVILYASILAAVYLLFITIDKRSFDPNSIALRTLLAVLSIELLMMWMFSTGNIIKAPHMMRINSPLIFLLAPSFYFYIHSKLKAVRQFRLLDSIHLIFGIVILIYLMPFYFQSEQEKLEMYGQWKNGMQIDLLPMEVIYRVQQLIYAIAIAVMLFKYWSKVSHMIFLTASAFIAIWLIDIIRYLFNIQESQVYVWIHFISFLPLLIFFELRFQHDRKKKYSTSGIQRSRTESIALQTYDLIVDEELYKNSRLSLNDVAAKLDLHHNYISQAINSTYGKKFKDMVNSMRVKEAKKLLGDKSMNHLTLEAIAEMSGFNSISSFNSSFKKIQNETPSSFKKKIQSS